MDFSFTDGQREVSALAERIFGDRVTAARLAEVESGAERIDRELWATLADAGLLGLAVPEQYGGGGLGLVELCLLLEQQGRRVAPVPLHSTLVAGALPIAAFGSTAQQQRWLPAVAAGAAIVTAALADRDSRDPLRPSTVAHRDGSGWRLEGTRPVVPSAHVAALVLVPATLADGGVAVFLVDPAASGVAIERAETTNREIHPHLHLAGVAVGDDDMLGDPARGSEIVRWIVDRAVAGLCALQLGVAEEAVRATALYTSERKQFGHPLATFQGVALRVADAYIDTEALRMTTWQAAWRLAEGLESERDVAVAKWWAAESGHRVVHAAQHLHGGLGADVDYPIHRYFLWGKQIELMLGGAGEQLARLGLLVADDARRLAAAGAAG